MKNKMILIIIFMWTINGCIVNNNSQSYYNDLTTYKEFNFLLITKNLSEFYNRDLSSYVLYYPANNELIKMLNKIGYSKNKYGFRIIGFINDKNDTILEINVLKKNKLIKNSTYLKDRYFSKEICLDCNKSYVKDIITETFFFKQKNGKWILKVNNYWDSLDFAPLPHD